MWNFCSSNITGNLGSPVSFRRTEGQLHSLTHRWPWHWQNILKIGWTLYWHTSWEGKVIFFPLNRTYWTHGLKLRLRLSRGISFKTERGKEKEKWKRNNMRCWNNMRWWHLIALKGHDFLHVCLVCVNQSYISKKKIFLVKLTSGNLANAVLISERFSQVADNELLTGCTLWRRCEAEKVWLHFKQLRQQQGQTASRLGSTQGSLSPAGRKLSSLSTWSHFN